MPFQKKLGSAVLPVAMILALASGTSSLAQQPARGDLHDTKGTVGPGQILQAPAGGKPAPPGPTTQKSPEKQPTTPQKPPEKKSDPPKQDAKPENKNQQQQPPPGGWDYSENFDEDHKGEFFKGNGNCYLYKDVPDDLRAAVKEATDYFKENRACIAAAGGPGGQPPALAVNDYRKSTGCMFIVDENGKFVKAVDAAYGIGSRKGGDEPEPGCGNGSLATPSGFHVTAVHAGGPSGRYDSNNSLLMQDLQGQGSAGRGILIHAGHCDGGACTWGCTGVSSNGETSEHTFEKLQQLLRPGSLVYNYFGKKSCPEERKGSCISGKGSSGSGNSTGTTNKRAQ